MGKSGTGGAKERGNDGSQKWEKWADTEKNRHRVANVYWLPKAESSYKERSFSTTLHGSNVWTTIWLSILLLPWRLLGLQSNNCQSGGPWKDSVYVSFQNLCLSKNAIWPLQCSSNISTMYASHILWFNWKEHWSIHGWFLGVWIILWCVLE